MDIAPPDADPAVEKDEPLRYDIRLLDRILGETIREQEGEDVFDTVEMIRQTALRFHREADHSAGRELEQIIAALPSAKAATVVRAYGYFSHLANIAEDQHHIRRARTPWPAHRRATARWRRRSTGLPPPNSCAVTAPAMPTSA